MMVEISRKIRTTWEYAKIGIELGASLRSKWILATMLPRLKLHGLLGYSDPKFYAACLRIGKFRWPVHFRDQDIFIFHEVFTGNGYVESVLHKDPPRCILDLGAHIGLATLRFAASFPEAVIHCYEPDLENYELLRLNTSTFENVVLHCEAVGPKTDKGVLYVSPKRHTASSLRPRQKVDSTYGVECMVKSLDDVISATGETVDFIKFDIEGGEHEVFTNSVLVHQVNYLVGEMKTSSENLENFLGIFPRHESQVQSVAKNMYLIHLFHRFVTSKKSI